MMTSSSSSAGARPSVAHGVLPELAEVVQVGTHGVLGGPLLGGEELAKRRQRLAPSTTDRSAATGSARIGRSNRIVSASVSAPASVPSSVSPSTPGVETSGPPSLSVRCSGAAAAASSSTWRTTSSWRSRPKEFARSSRRIPSLPACPSPRPYGYRSKLTPHFPRPRADRPRAIGFLEVGLPRRTLDVPTCPIAMPAVNARLAELRAEVHGPLGTYRRGATLLVREAASGVTVDPRAVITEQVGDLSLQFLAGDFFQNNPFLLPRLAATSPPRRSRAAPGSSSTPTAAAACWAWRPRPPSSGCSASR